jgi:hypothetical protein
MPFPLSLNQAEYETLVEYARQGTLNADGNVIAEKALGLDAWLRYIEGKNDIHRYFVWVQWQEQDAPLPAGTVFPEKWPPELRAFIALTSRKISRADVYAVLEQRARQPTSVLVTNDPAAKVGWTEVDQYFA